MPFYFGFGDLCQLPACQSWEDSNQVQAYFYSKLGFWLPACGFIQCSPSGFWCSASLEQFVSGSRAGRIGGPGALLTPEQPLVASPQGLGSAHLQPSGVSHHQVLLPFRAEGLGHPLTSSGPVPLPEFSSSLNNSGCWTLCLFFGQAHSRLLVATEQETYCPQSYSGAPFTFFPLLYAVWGRSV